VIDNILRKASIVLNRTYTGYNVHTASGKDFIGVEIEGLRYSALSMSAGEQKVFYILETIFRAGKYSLILVDELDLLLHDSAMKKLVEVLLERAKQKQLQIIFTTHRESILDLEEKVNIRHIINKSGKTLCFNETKPDAINRLTGVQLKPLEVFVEDDLASTIVKKVAAQLRIAKYLTVNRYGAAINCFTTAGGLLLGGDACKDTLFVLDGDVYSTRNEKTAALNKVLTGHDQNVNEARAQAISLVKQFSLPENQQPERYIHSILVTMLETDDEERNEIIDVAREVEVVDDDHRYISDIIDRLGWDKNTGLSKIVDIVATSQQWYNYVYEVRTWLEGKADQVRE